jgi:hypothetical protein
MIGRRGREAAGEHNLRRVSMGASSVEAQDPGVLVSPTVTERMRDLLPQDAAAVARAILKVPQRQSERIRLYVPGDPPGTEYFALMPASPQAPVVIYRGHLPGESGKWLVTALMDRDSYRQYRHVADNAVVQGVAAVVAAGTVVASSPTVSAAGSVSAGSFSPEPVPTTAGHVTSEPVLSRYEPNGTVPWPFSGESTSEEDVDSPSREGSSTSEDAG